MTASFIIENKGDGEGLDILDGATGDAVLLGRDTDEVIVFLEGQSQGANIWVEAGSFGEQIHEGEYGIDDLLGELYFLP